MRFLYYMGMGVMKFTQVLFKAGFWLYRKGATVDERIAYMNATLKPFGLEVAPRESTQQGEFPPLSDLEKVNNYLSKYAKHSDGSYDN